VESHWVDASYGVAGNSKVQQVHPKQDVEIEALLSHKTQRHGARCRFQLKQIVFKENVRFPGV
jgi:hypothetical protein